jgi:enoyl-CoA hydratase/carnithine racemase
MDVPRVPHAVRADQEAIAVADAVGVRTITLARPEARNALTEPMVAALHEEVVRAGRDEGVRALVLTGSGLAASSDLQSAMAAETIAQSLLVATDDHREGVRAARERRPPEFTGR